MVEQECVYYGAKICRLKIGITFNLLRLSFTFWSMVEICRLKIGVTFVKGYSF